MSKLPKARYRSSDAEIYAAEHARELYYQLDEIGGMLAPDDPLLRAVEVAQCALVTGLSASPVLRLDPARTVLEMLLPHGPAALARVDATGSTTDELLHQMHETAMRRPTGPAVKRRWLVDLVFVAARHLRAVLAGETTEGVFVPRLMTPKKLREALKTVCAINDVREQPVAALYIDSFAASVGWRFALRYGGDKLDYALVYNALAALVQEEERAGPGRLVKGALNHLAAMRELVEAAGLAPRESKTVSRTKSDTGREPAWIKKDVDLARRSMQTRAISILGAGRKQRRRAKLPTP